MKKTSKITAIILSLAIIFCLCSVTTFAADVSVAGEEMVSSVFEDEIMSDVFGLWAFIVIASLISSLSLPALIVMIIFIVKNGNAKKDLKQYEKLFGPLEAYNTAPIPQPIVQNIQQPVSQPVTQPSPSVEPADTAAPASENNQGGNM